MAGSAAAYYRLAMNLDWLFWAMGFGAGFIVLQRVVFGAALGQTRAP
jgi:hypothetical protein